MQAAKYVTIISNKRKIVLGVESILYVLMVNDKAEIHVSGGQCYETWMSLGKLEKMLGDGFIKVHRGCIVAVRAIHNITDKINLSNGEALSYTLRKKRNIIEQFRDKQRCVVNNFEAEGFSTNFEEYKKYYTGFENMPFAFVDIELIFDEEKHALDWIFCYGNEALAKLEKLPLEQLIGSSFGSLFENMDAKWLKSYERATLYGEILEMLDYSPEVDRYLKVICFPTFPGHCGCILFDISQIRFTQNSSDAQKAMMLYFRGQRDK